MTIRAKYPFKGARQAAHLKRALAQADNSATTEQLDALKKTPTNHGREFGPWHQPSGLSINKANIDAWSARAEHHGRQARLGKADYGRETVDTGHNIPEPGAGGFDIEKKAKD
jgi:hypothetical protein